MGEKVGEGRMWGDVWKACVQGFMEFEQLSRFLVSTLHLSTRSIELTYLDSFRMMMLFAYAC
jgi:hypothetical protein